MERVARELIRKETLERGELDRIVTAAEGQAPAQVPSAAVRA